VSRITPGTVIVGIFAVLFGLVGAYGVRKYLQDGQPVPPPAPAAPRTTVVPLASMDLQPGRPLVLGDIGIHMLTNEQMAKMRKDGKLPVVFMTNPDQIMGRILKVPLKQGEAFQTDSFYPDGSGPTVAEKLGPGLRAVTISVEGTGALGGYDGPGSIVDVLFRTAADDKSGIPEATVTLLEGVEVLGMEQAAARQPAGVSLQNRVTLAVTAQQANALKIAEGRGTFSLTLRNPDDVEVAAATVPQTLDALLNLPARREFVTQIYRGGGLGQHSVASFAAAPVTPPPVLALPVAGALQMRARQQPASVEKNADPTQSGGKDGADKPAAADETPATSADAAPAGAAQAAGPSQAEPTDGEAAEAPVSEAGSLATVTEQLPVSVLRGDEKAGPVTATVPAATPAAAAPPAPSDAAAGTGSVTPPARPRPRKLLSDIGRKYWEQMDQDRGSRGRDL